jgi:hypothetical protein
MKTWGSGGIAPLFLTSAVDGDEWSATRLCRFTPRGPLDRRLGEPQSRSGRCGEEKNLALPEIEPRSSIPYPISIPTELSGLHRFRPFFSELCAINIKQ